MLPRWSKSFLKGAIYEIEEAGSSASVPDWAGSSDPLSHFALLAAMRGEALWQPDDGLPPMRLKGDSVLLLAPGEAPRLEPEGSEGVELQWIVFDLFLPESRLGERRSFVRQTAMPLQGLLRVAGQRHRRLLRRLAAQAVQAREHGWHGAQQLLHDLLASLIAGARPAARDELLDRLDRAAETMQAAYREPLRIESLAEEAGLHPGYFSQVFKQRWGKTPLAYLTAIRLNRAKELLLGEGRQRPIREIAAECGYPDEFYFSRRFKADAGRSPARYAASAPARIVCLSAPYTDHLLALGVQPAAAQLPAYALAPDALARGLRLPEHAVDPWEAQRGDFEELRPELILCKPNVEAKAREQLADIAPVRSVPWNGLDVYGQMEEIARLTGRADEARRWRERHDALAARVRSRTEAAVGGASFTCLAAMRRGLRIYGERNLGHALYRSLGYAPGGRIADELRQHPPGTGFNWTAIAPDELRRYESDALLLFAGSPQEREELLELVARNPHWQRHPAIRSGRWALLDRGFWLPYAPSALLRQLEELEPLLPRLMAGQAAPF